MTPVNVELKRDGVGIGVVPMDEAIKVAKARGVVLPETYYERLQGAARARGFTVSGIEAIEQIARVLASLIDALVSGGTFDDWKRGFADKLMPEQSAARKELVFRNMMQSAYGAGRWHQFEQVKHRRPIIMYDAVDDDRTRKNHRAMDGFMAHITDPIWKEWQPPNGHNCRCSTINLTIEQARARGYRDNMQRPNVHPDPGWGHNPAKGFSDVLKDIAKEKVRELPVTMRDAARRAVEQD